MGDLQVACFWDPGTLKLQIFGFGNSERCPAITPLPSPSSPPPRWRRINSNGKKKLLPLCFLRSPEVSCCGVRVKLQENTQRERATRRTYRITGKRASVSNTMQDGLLLLAVVAFTMSLDTQNIPDTVPTWGRGTFTILFRPKHSDQNNNTR